MATKETKYDLAELLNGNIDGVTSKFTDMSDDDLAKLGELESQGQKRAGLSSAIEREQASRAEAAAAKAGTPTGASKTAPKPAEKAAVADALKGTGTRRGDRAAGTAAKSAKAKPRVTGKVAFGAKATNPLAGEANTVVFTDTEGTLLDIPPLTFGSEQFGPATTPQARGAFVLNERITFGPETPRGTIGAAWLVDDTGAGAMRSALMAPMVVGGGRSAEIPKGHLMFVPESAAERDARLERAA